MKTFKIWLGIFFIFMFGVFVGVFGTAAHLRRVIIQVRERGPEERKKVILKKLVKRLDLSDPQQQNIGDIILSGDTEMREEFNKCHPQIKATLINSLVQIRAELTEEQKKKFDKLSQRMRKVHGLAPN